MRLPEDILRGLEQLEAQFAEALSVHSALVGGTFAGTNALRILNHNKEGLAERGPRAMEQIRQRLVEVGVGEVDGEYFTQAAAAIFKEVMIGPDGSEVKMEMLRSALAHSVSGGGLSLYLLVLTAMQMAKGKEDQESDQDDPPDDMAQPPGSGNSGGARRRRKRRSRRRAATSEDFGEMFGGLGKIDPG